MVKHKQTEPARTVSHHEGDAVIQRAHEWFQKHKRNVIMGAVGVGIVGGGIWFSVSARERRESFGERALNSARASVTAGNLPLAESDLSRVVSDFGATAAGNEAALLLAHVRLLQGNTSSAVAGLRDFVAAGPRRHFLAEAYGLLGAGLEEIGQMGEASQAYSAAAAAAEYDFLRAEFLNSAGRTAALAGDREVAAGYYRRVFTEFEDAPGATEARVRYAELGFLD